MAKLHPISKTCDDPQRKADVVFIHGLGGDAFGTWRHGEGDDTSWPHWLAEAFPDVGVWSLGHAADPSKPLGLLAKLVGKGGRDAGQGMSLPDRAVQVLDGMRLDKRFRGERPIVFVCHSLGGLLAKQILRQAHDNAGNADPESMSRRTAAVLFLATPHHGADLATLIDNFAAIFGPTASLTTLKAHDSHLRNLYNWYRNHAPKLGIATETYFEGRDRLGFRIVDETSSQPGVGPDAVMLDEDHLSIAKPRERDAQVCLALEALLRNVVARSHEPSGADVQPAGRLANPPATAAPLALHAQSPSAPTSAESTIPRGLQPPGYVFRGPSESANPHGEGTTPDDDGRIGGDQKTGYSKPPELKPPILLLTVNPRETDALRAVFCNAQAPEDFTCGDYPYQRFAPVTDKAGRLEREVIAFCCQMGSARSGAAQQRVTKAIEHFEPAAVLAVGVGFGLRDKQRLGDVMISAQVTDYESARLNRDGSIELRAETTAATPAWLERAERIDLPGIQRRKGLLLCGEKLVDNSAFRESLRRHYPLAVGGDMESFGIVTACNGHDRVKIGWLIIKGVSDLGDGDKNAGGPMQADLDQYQAAYRAAMVAYSAVHLRRPDAPPPREAAHAWLKAQADAGSDDWLSLDPSGEISRPSAHPRNPSAWVPAASPIPPNLRLADYGFFGRTEQQARLLQRLRAGQTTAVVGGPGLGKTALVAKALRTLLGDTEAAQRQALAGLPFPDGIVFLDLYALHGQADPAWEALASAVAPQAPDDAGATRAMPARERAIAACRGKRFLLVVEGGEEARGTAEPGDDARTTRHALLDPLALQGPVLWLTRSAAQSNKNEWIRIDTTLGIDDARELFDAIAGTDVPRTVRDAALEALHGHPLAITWVAALIAREDEPPDLLLADLRQQPSLLQLQDPERPHRTLRWLFDRSLRGLDADARRSLLAAGLLAADAFPLEAIAAATGLDDGAQREALRACVQAHLLRWQKDDSGVALWRFGHALAYGYAREQARVEPETAAALLPGLAEWAHVTLKAGLAVNAPPAATAAVSRTLAHALALLAADTPPGLWRPLAEDLLYDFGDRFEALGQLTRALEVCRAVARWLALAQAAQPEAAQWLRESAACYSRLGNLDLAQGDLAGAELHHAETLVIVERLAAQDPADAEWQRDLSVSHNKLGDVQRAQGDLPGAQRHYAAALAIRERFAAQDPANAVWQRDLSVSHSKLGGVQQAQGDLSGAQRHYAAMLAIAERLAAQDPANAERQRDLSIGHNKLGALQQAQGDLPGAQRHYAADLAIAERLVAQDPANAGWQRDLSVSHNKLGEVQQAQGDLHGAQRHYAAGLAIAERLAAQDPANAGWQRDLSVSHNKLGNVQQAKGDLPGARRHYAAALAIRERLAAQDPANADWQRDLAVSRVNLAAVRAADGDVPAALAHLQAARAILQALRQRAPEYPQFQRDLVWVEQKIAELERDAAT
jgi:nucleoside phosphorylase/tetratricopeptide (TPR) repeat protein